MRISELIEELQTYLDTVGDLEVMSSSNYGDYHKTEQLDPIVILEMCTPEESAYSNSGLAFPGDDQEDYDEDDPSTILEAEQTLVLRYTSDMPY